MNAAASDQVSSSPAARTTRHSGPTRDLRRFWPAGLLAVLYVAAFRHGLILVARIAGTDPDWSHALLVPVVTAYLLRQRWSTVTQTPQRTCWLGLVLLLGCSCLYSLGLVLNSSMLTGYPMVAAVLCLILLTRGPDAARFLAAPVLYLLFAIKISVLWAPFAAWLQRVAAACAAALITTTAMPLSMQAEAVGSLIRLYRHGRLLTPPLNVDEACSGLRMLMALVALSAAYALAVRRARFVRLAVFAAAVPVAMLVNILRIALTGLIFPFWPKVVSAVPHTTAGLLMVGPALACLWLVERTGMWLLNRPQVRTRQAPVKARPRPNRTEVPPRHLIAVWAGAGLLFTVACGLRPTTRALGVALIKQPVAPILELTAIPTRIGPYKQVQDTRLPSHAEEVLGTIRYISRVYAMTGSEAVGAPTSAVWFHVAYYTGAVETVAVRHTPDVCYTGAGHQRIDHVRAQIALAEQTANTTAPDAPNNLPVTVFRFIPAGSARPAAAVYFFIVNGRFVPSRERLRFTLATMHAANLYYCKIEVLPGQWAETTEVGRPAFAPQPTDTAGAVASVTAFLRHALPEVQRCLPEATYRGRRRATQRQIYGQKRAGLPVFP